MVHSKLDYMYNVGLVAGAMKTCLHASCMSLVRLVVGNENLDEEKFVFGR